MKKTVSLVLCLALMAAFVCSAVSCGGLEPVGTGASDHVGVRSTEGRTLRFVRMSVRGYGSIIILLEESTAPKTVANFMKLVNEGFYDGLTFHRVKAGFMIQGGDPKANGTGGSGVNIEGEFLLNGFVNDLSHLRGTISMARGQENDTASSQFFICNADATSSLNYRYAAFGYVISGMSVVDEITAKTGIYGDSDSYTIDDKSKQAVINRVVEISAEEAFSYLPNA